MTQQHHATCEIKGATSPEYLEILTPEAQDFLAALATKFEGKRQECLAYRVEMQKSIEQGNDLDFPPETAEIRSVYPLRRSRPPCGDHRTGRPENGDQRPEFRRQRFHGRL